MTNQDIFRELTNINPAYILAAAPRAESAPRRRGRLLRWGSLAACICLAAVLAIHIKVAFTPALLCLSNNCQSKGCFTR